jgi:hypothetical protein
LCLHRDGTVHLGDPEDYVSRWQYAFMDDKDDEEPPQFITVLHISPNEINIDKNAGNVVHGIPFDDDIISQLKDSDKLAKVYHRPQDVKRMKGKDNDCVLYFMEKMMAPVAILQNWKGQFLKIDPVTLEKIDAF